MYAVKEIFCSLNGEGARSGRPAVFCRFSGCNLWSGLEADRGSALCRFCDTDFAGTDGRRGGRYGAADLAAALATAWKQGVGGGAGKAYAIFTGGEPALQLDAELLRLVKSEGFETAVETNGTRPLPAGIDWICVSPKAGTEIVIRGGDELKLVYPQVGSDPETYTGLEFRHFFLQPMDIPGSDRRHWRAAADYCRQHPRWKLSLQVHKLLGLP